MGATLKLYSIQAADCALPKIVSEKMHHSTTASERCFYSPTGQRLLSRE